MVRPVRSPILVALLLVLPAPTLAQQPHPCDALAQAYAIKWCVGREASLADSVYAITARATIAAYPAAFRDSVAAVERAWLEQHSRAVEQETDPLRQLSLNLIGKRRRVFRLRHQILSLAAANDESRMRPIPVFQAWSGTASNRGLVLTLFNGTVSPVEFQVRFYDPESDRLDERSLRILPQSNIRISWIEGWEWQPGMQLQILHPLYAPLLNEARLAPGR